MTIGGFVIAMLVGLLVALGRMSNNGFARNIAIFYIETIRGIPVLVDGSQAAVHMPVDVQDIDCDWYAFTGHKVYGPSGIGVLYGKKKMLESMRPFQGGGEVHGRAGGGGAVVDSARFSGPNRQNRRKRLARSPRTGKRPAGLRP